MHSKLVDIYGDNLMTHSMVRKWVKQFNNGLTNFVKKLWVGGLLLLVEKVNEKFEETDGSL